MSHRDPRVKSFTTLNGLEIIGAVIDDSGSDFIITGGLAFFITEQTDAQGQVTPALGVQPPSPLMHMNNNDGCDFTMPKTAVLFMYETPQHLYDQYAAMTNKIRLAVA